MGERKFTCFQLSIEALGLPASTLISDSNIIKELSQAKIIDNWLREDGSAGDMTLLYRSSKDGSSVDAFHNKCDNKPNTLVKIETVECGIVGGYTNKAWGSTSDGTLRIKRSSLHFLDLVFRLRITYVPVFGTFIELGPTDGFNNDLGYDIKEMEVFQVSSANHDPRKEKQLSAGPEEKVSSVDRFTKEVNDAINEKWVTLQELEEEVFSLEERYKDEGRFIDSFASGDTNDDVMLKFSGTMMATIRATLMFAEDSCLHSSLMTQNGPSKGVTYEGKGMPLFGRPMSYEPRQVPHDGVRVGRAGGTLRLPITALSTKINVPWKTNLHAKQTNHGETP